MVMEMVKKLTGDCAVDSSAVGDTGGLSATMIEMVVPHRNCVCAGDATAGGDTR